MYFPPRVIIALILGYLAGVIEGSGETHEYPCTFNSLCKCAINSTGNEVHHKLVFCNHIPLSRIPDIPSNNVTKLSIVGSGLEVLDDNSLRHLELATLSLAKNDLVIITDEALVYSAKVLAALDLSYNRLQKIPQKALGSLSALQLLSLESNEINTLLVDWNYLKQTLQTLFLGGNNINILTSAIDYSLGNFQKLISLNLNNNYITSLEQNSLPFTLKSLHVSNNLIDEFPAHLINNLDELTKLYINDNYIQQLPPFKFKQNKQLDTLDLSNNFLTNLNDIFGRTMMIKEINLSYNNLQSINAYSFNGINCMKLDLSHNKLNTLSEKAFYGLKNTLEDLDLSYNGIVRMPKSIVSLRKLKTLSLAHNNIATLPDGTFKNSSQYLHILKLSGNLLHSFPKYTLRNIKRLLKLEISYNYINDIRSSDFIRWGDQLELLSIKSNKITSLEYNAFKNLSKLKKLSLAFNNIKMIDNKAFSNLAIPLKYLDVSFALKLDSYPEESLKLLKNIEQLILINNNFTSLPKTALYNFIKLQYLNLDFNHITEISDAFFNPYILKHLRDIRLAFNKLYMIDSNTFLDLYSLQYIGLNDNEITSINSGAFKNLTSKLTIALSNNDIHMISNRAFINLPNLVKLDLHDNDLQTFDLNIFHNVTNNLNAMTLNLSRNRIENIVPSNTYLQIHLDTLDISHNKLKSLNAEVFQFFNNSLKTLILDYNNMDMLTDKMFVLLKSLEILNIEHNKLKELKETTFSGLDKLQILDLSHNHISRINIRQFANLWNLRILDLSYNELSTIPGEAFLNTKLERLILKHNRFSVIPPQAFYEIGKSLQYIDLSNNMIEHLDKDVFNSIRGLTNINVCSNYLSQIQENVFTHLDNLINLQLCNNRLTNMDAIYKIKNLHYLNLANTGLKEIPNLQFEHLAHLNLSGNNISRLMQGFLIGLPNLRHLDLSKNNLTNWNVVGWNHAQYLKELDVSGNPIKILTKDTFEGLENLKILNLQNLKYLERFDSDSLSKCKLLTWLKIQTWPNIEKYRFRLPSVIFGLKHLKKLTVNVLEEKLTDQLVQGFPPKLKFLEITGANLKVVNTEALKGLDGSKELTIKFSGTNITTFPPIFFWKFTSGKLTLDLRDNGLDQIGPEMFYKSAASVRKYGTKPYTGGIHIQNNPILCNCDSHWLGYWQKRYLIETLRIHQKEPEYSTNIIEHMKEATCLNPLNGKHVPILSFEMNGCDVSLATIFHINFHLLFVTMFVAYLVR